MTIFLLVTAAMNIALGYGLAIYLGRAQSGGMSKPLNDALDAHLEAHLEAHEPEPAEPTVAVAAPTLSASRVASPFGVPLAEPAAATAAPEASGDRELEHEVLAGIEEFRNQLAQMKNQPAAPSPAKLAAAGV